MVCISHPATGYQKRYVFIRLLVLSLGITFAYLVQLIADYFAIKQSDLLSSSKQPVRVRARSLLCFWAVQELGMTATTVAREIGMTQPAVSRAVERGRGIAGEVDIRLLVQCKL